MLKKIVLMSVFAILLWSCSSDEGNSTGNGEDGFDRRAMLVHWADNIIIPAYGEFASSATELENSVAIFVQDPTESTLLQLREKWEEAYLAFQEVSMFEIGPAETVFFRNRLNTYPTNTSEIEDFIASGSYDLSLPSTIDAQGFPALDYLLNGLAATDAEIVVFYTTHPEAENYKMYITSLANAISNLSDTVSTTWTDSYRDTFVNNDGSSASASVDKFSNDFVFYYEKALRAGKVGIPAGVFSGAPLPGNVEALYKANISKQLALKALEATQDFFMGKSFNGNQIGASFKSYLDYLNTIKNGEDLAGLVIAQFEQAKAAINQLDANFIDQIQNDNSKMLNAYDELQRNVILMKVDMLQAMDVNVDYVDTDGD